MVNTSKDLLKSLRENQPSFSKFLGMIIVEANETQVFAEMLVKEEFSNRNGVMHGGAIMAFADNIAGTATFLHLEKGMSTTTIESKTNFFRPIKIGDLIKAQCDILKKGKKIVVLQTTIYRPDKKIAAIITQTQIILKFKKLQS
ncbi:MAG: PaaI family thioesterase [Paracoccaceae bacterium]|nr:PaaI family thioesterase [Paracoccaceae bacterium]